MPFYSRSFWRLLCSGRQIIICPVDDDAVFHAPAHRFYLKATCSSGLPPMCSWFALFKIDGRIWNNLENAHQLLAGWALAAGKSKTENLKARPSCRARICSTMMPRCRRCLQDLCYCAVKAKAPQEVARAGWRKEFPYHAVLLKLGELERILNDHRHWRAGNFAGLRRIPACCGCWALPVGRFISVALENDLHQRQTGAGACDDAENRPDACRANYRAPFSWRRFNAAHAWRFLRPA